MSAEIQHKESKHHHLMSFKTHMNVFGALLVLTVITVGAAQFDFGIFGTFVAMFIATLKAILVVGWFMHLKYDGAMNRVIFSTAFFFLLLFAVISLIDIYSRINPRL